jgi:hypothetical protein
LNPLYTLSKLKIIPVHIEKANRFSTETAITSDHYQLRVFAQAKAQGVCVSRIEKKQRKQLLGALAKAIFNE